MIVGCGDVGLRAARQLPRNAGLMALTSSAGARARVARAQASRRCRATWTTAPRLRRLAGLATRVLHLAPPPNDKPDWRGDPRTLALLRALRLRSLPRSLVYASTSGVYGDCGGEWVRETRPLSPHTPRAQRRVHAEAHVRLFGRAAGTRVHLLRIPGIYAPDREGGTPRGRLLKGTPVLRAEDDVYTNHIHADDLARACLAALWRGKPQRVTMPATTPSSRWATTSTWRPTSTACRGRRAWRAARAQERAAADAAELHERVAPAGQHPAEAGVAPAPALPDGQGGAQGPLEGLRTGYFLSMLRKGIGAEP